MKRRLFAHKDRARYTVEDRKHAEKSSTLMKKKIEAESKFIDERVDAALANMAGHLTIDGIREGPIRRSVADAFFDRVLGPENPEDQVRSEQIANYATEQAMAASSMRVMISGLIPPLPGDVMAWLGSHIVSVIYDPDRRAYFCTDSDGGTSIMTLQALIETLNGTQPRNTDGAQDADENNPRNSS